MDQNGLRMDRNWTKIESKTDQKWIKVGSKLEHKCMKYRPNLSQAWFGNAQKIDQDGAKVQKKHHKMVEKDLKKAWLPRL